MSAVVLLSGGWDSAYCALVASPLRPCCVFIDYGQAFASQERVAAQAVARALGLDLKERYMQQLKARHDGVVPGRNLRLLQLAIDTTGADTVFFGCRNPSPLLDRFGDSNWVWGKAAGWLLDVSVRMPCVGLTKRTIGNRLERAGLPLSTLYSTEA